MKVIYIGTVVAVSAIFASWGMKWILPKLSMASFKKIGYYSMVISGFLMLSKSGSDFQEASIANVSTAFKIKDLGEKHKWQKIHYGFEFYYDEGFEFDQLIQINELTSEQQSLVASYKSNADKIMIEAVYGINSKYYEAYYFKNNKLIEKIDF